MACSDSAAGLKHIHDNNVIHMDIKPENIFLKDTGMFKVGDFGIAVRVPVSGGWEEGDGRYVAPELLCRSHAPTPGADVYSLGATILHSATGETFLDQNVCVSPFCTCLEMIGYELYCREHLKRRSSTGLCSTETGFCRLQ